MQIDINADLGEGAGADAALMPLITSANVSCGFHAGDPEGIRATLELAREQGVVVGAHPGFPDRANFGRVEQTLTDRALGSLLHYQLGALAGLARASGVSVRYVKPHGALYHQACREERVARAVAAVAFQHGLAVMGLPGSALASACAALKVPFVGEGFADRRYRPDGSLVPRSDPGAFVDDPEEAVAQVQRLVTRQQIRTICVHGDNPEALAFVNAVRAALISHGFKFKAFA